MFIAFEGPDETGKSTSAKTLATSGEAIYNIQREQYKAIMGMGIPEARVATFDRVDWLTHMVYRLALPHKDWHDDRIRTVFAMPETHLVLKIHHPQMVELVEARGEGYATSDLGKVNELYWHQIDFLAQWNLRTDYSLFKSISVMQVIHDQPNNHFQQALAWHWSKDYTASAYEKIVDSDERLLEFLQYVESNAA